MSSTSQCLQGPGLQRTRCLAQTMPTTRSRCTDPGQLLVITDYDTPSLRFPSRVSLLPFQVQCQCQWRVRANNGIPQSESLPLVVQSNTNLESELSMIRVDLLVTGPGTTVARAAFYHHRHYECMAARSQDCRRSLIRNDSSS
jgi:hypothetical protein